MKIALLLCLYGSGAGHRIIPSCRVTTRGWLWDCSIAGAGFCIDAQIPSGTTELPKTSDWAKLVSLQPEKQRRTGALGFFFLIIGYQGSECASDERLLGGVEGQPAPSSAPTGSCGVSNARAKLSSAVGKRAAAAPSLVALPVPSVPRTAGGPAVCRGHPGCGMRLPGGCTCCRAAIHVPGSAE